MIFETITDENGKISIKQLSYSPDRQEYSHNTIKPSIFPDLSNSQKRELEIINHFFKENMFLSLSCFDKKNPHIQNHEFDAINFQSLFKGIFSTIFDVFKENFFLNERGELINTHGGYSLKMDKENQGIHFEKLPGYETFWNKEEKSLKCRPKKSENFDTREHITVRPYDYISIEFKRQFLLHISDFFKTDRYSVDLPLVTEKMFNHLNKDGYLKDINSFDDFKKEVEIVKHEYYSNEKFFIDDLDYIAGQKEFLEINQGSLFDFFDKRMSSLFSKKYSNGFSLTYHDNDLLSDLEQHKFRQPPTKNIFINPERLDEINRILSVYTNIQYRMYREKALYNPAADYLFDVDRGFIDENKNHRVHNLSYSDFLEYYHMADNTMNLCFYCYMYEFSLIDEKMHDYIDDIILAFTNSNEKAQLILSERGISILDFNEQIKLPLPIIKNFCNKESKALYKIAVELYSKNVSKLTELNGTSDDIKILFNYATANNDNKKFFKQLDDSDYFTSSKNIVDFINAIYEMFEKCRENPFENIDLDSYIKIKIKEQEEEDDEDPMDWISRISAEKKNPPKPRNLNNSELIDIVAGKIISLSIGEYASDQKEIINNLIWLDKKLSIYNEKIMCFKRDIHLPDECEICRIEDRSEKIQVMSLLDYHLLKGHDDVVYYLKGKGFVPYKTENHITSIEYALLGACKDDIIDWVCESLDIIPQHKVNIFNFVRLPLSFRFETQQTINFTVLESMEYEYFFNYNSKHKDDRKVLEKMIYLYDKYHVDFSNNCERIYYLLNEKNEKIIKEYLGIDKLLIEKIEYSLLIKKLISQNDLVQLKDEIKTGRLTLNMGLMHEFIYNKEVSGILNLIYKHLKYKCDDRTVKFVENLVNLILENMGENIKCDFKNFKCFDGLNIFEIVMSKDVHEFRELIKKMVVDYDFNLKSGMYVKNDNTQEKVYKTYREVYFDSQVYTRNLYDFLVSQSEKEKIEKNINFNDGEHVKKRRM